MKLEVRNVNIVITLGKLVSVRLCSCAATMRGRVLLVRFYSCNGTLMSMRQFLSNDFKAYTNGIHKIDVCEPLVKIILLTWFLSPFPPRITLTYLYNSNLEASATLSNVYRISYQI